VSDSLVGGVVDTRYEVRRLIARGGMGLVCEAYHRFTRRAVAIKVLADHVRNMKEAQSRLLREALALTAVRHPGFVEVLDAGVCGTHGPYVAMEMLDGRSLDGILAARTRLPIADAVQVALQVCDTVAHAHARGVIHRDLKPANFFVARSETGQEVVKLIDLGVAAVAAEQLEQHDHKLTVAHEVLGTPEYMAPEQLWGRAVDARTDVYAIGMSLFECLTGDVPYNGTYPEVLVQVSNAPGPPKVRERRPDVPEALAGAIEMALEKEPSARFQTASALARALMATSGLAQARSDLLPPLSLAPEAGGERQSLRPEPAIALVRKKPVKGAPEASSAQARRFVRAPYVTPVLLVTAGGVETEGRCEEISEGGMLVVSSLALEGNSALELRFATPVAGDMVRVQANVRWATKGRGRCAMGLEFNGAPASLRGVISQYAQMFHEAHTG
jgi:serine/threonine protein kinase